MLLKVLQIFAILYESTVKILENGLVHLPMLGITNVSNC